MIILNSSRPLKSINIIYIFSFLLIIFLNLGISSINNGFLYFYQKQSILPSLFIILIISINYLFNTGKNRMFPKKVLFLLFLMNLFGLITILINKLSFNDSLHIIFINSLPIFITTFVFLINNTRLDFHKFGLTIVSIYSTWLSLQTIFQFVNLFLSKGLIDKGLLVTAVGGSNFIAAHLLITTIFLINYSDIHLKFSFNKVAAIISIISIIMTLSFGAYITFVFVILFALFIKFNTVVLKIIFSIGFISIAGFFLLIIVPYLLSNFLTVDSFLYNTFFTINIKVNYFLQGDFTRLFSARDDLYILSFEQFLNNPFFGSGEFITFNGIEFRTHNWILDSLLKHGIFFGFLFILTLISILKSINKYSKNNNFLSSIKFSLLSAIVHGLVEPNFFSRSFDIIFWTIVGFALVEINAVSSFKINKTIFY